MKTMKRPLSLILVVYVICYLFRIIEYLFIRTDQTVIGEAFIHKILGIVVLGIVIKYLNSSFKEIGFDKKGILKNVAYGIGFGLSVFLIGYGVEASICAASGKTVTIGFYVTTYAVDKNVGMNTAFIFFLICIAGNVINVMMEEGVFRGLFQKMLETKYSFICSALIASFLFGAWHVMGPIRNYMDGASSLGGSIANIIMLFTTSALIGFKFAMMSHMEGALYMGMGDHFVNNTIVNLLHVTTDTGTDEMMFLRITVAQTVSFIIVLVVYIKREKKNYRRIRYVLKEKLDKKKAYGLSGHNSTIYIGTINHRINQWRAFFMY